MGGPLLPQWIDRVRPLVGLALIVVPVYAGAMVYYGTQPETTDVGYSPKQPVPFSHKLHAGELILDCRYCHTTVETAARAAVPSTEICMNCHANIAPTSEKLIVVRESYTSDRPIPWVRVHDLPDFAYFYHSAHVTKGIGCVECHGRIDTMDQVVQAKSLQMGWCLECHRNPEPRLQPRDQITNLSWVPQEKMEVLGPKLREEYKIKTSTDCSTCHR